MKPKSAQQSEPFRVGEIDGVVIRELRMFADARGWLFELFRQDDLEPEYFPKMAYVSSTRAGAQRGPHEHIDQADLFYFIGPSNFKLRMWDKRPDSKTYNHVFTSLVGEDNPSSVLIPKGVVHGYCNVGPGDGIVINCPNQLYMGQDKREPVDEIRYEDDPDTIYRMDD